MTDIRAAAAAYIARGFRVVPLYGVDALGRCRCGDAACKPRDAGKHAPPGFEDRAKDGPPFAAADFSEGDNIAIMLGPWTGTDRWLAALDFDGGGPADWSLDNAAMAGLMPRTLTQVTPRGKHLVFWVPAFTPLGNWVDCWSTKDKGYQMDLRYARGRIVVEPSRGATGAYRWVDVNADIAELPRGIIETILNERRRRGLPVLPRWERERGKRP